MVLHKICSSPQHLRLRRGTQGQTIQSIEVVRDGRSNPVRLTIMGLRGQQTSADLDIDEVVALRDWLMLVPIPDSQIRK